MTVNCGVWTRQETSQRPGETGGTGTRLLGRLIGHCHRVLSGWLGGGVEKGLCVCARVCGLLKATRSRAGRGGTQTTRLPPG